MLRIIKAFWDICLFRAGPQDLPTSSLLMAVALFGYGAASLLIAFAQFPPERVFAAVALDIVLLLMLAWAVLWVRSFMERFTQTLTALAGVGALMGFIAWPLAVWQADAVAQGPETAGVPSLIVLAWLAWHIAVVGHVLRHALSTMMSVGATLAVVYVYVGIRLTSILFGPLG